MKLHDIFKVRFWISRWGIVLLVLLWSAIVLAGLFHANDHDERLKAGLDPLNAEQTLLARSYHLHVLLGLAGAWVLGLACLLVSARILQRRRDETTQSAEAVEHYREIEERFRLIADNTADVIWLFDLNSNGFEYVSPSVEKVLGYKPSEGLGRPLTDFLSPASADFVRQAHPVRLEAFLKGDKSIGSQIYELEIRTASGRTIASETLSTLIADKSGRPVKMLGVSRDITRRKEYENALEALLRSTAASTGNAFAELLVRELAKVLGVKYALLGRFIPGKEDHVKTVALWANGQLVDNLEYSLAGAPCGRLVSGNICHIEEGVRSLFPKNVLLQQMSAEGYFGAPLLSASGKMIGVLVAMDSRPIPQNATFHSLLTLFAVRASVELEREGAIGALAESEARVRQIVENSQAGYYRIGADRNYEDVNQAWLDMHGFKSRRDVVGKHFSLTQTQDDLPVAVAIVERIFAGHHQPPGEFTRKCADGSVAYHTLTANPVTRSSAITGMDGFIIDTTESRRAEAELRRDEAKIRRQAALLDITRDAICVLGADYSIDFWNRGAESLFGWSADEAMGCDWEILAFKQESPEFRAAWKHVMEEGEWMGELKALTKTAKLRILQCRATRVDPSEGEAVSALFVCTDVTEARNLEAQFLHMQRIDSLGAIASGIAHDLNNILSPILMSVDLLPAKLTKPEDKTMVDMLRASAHRGAEIVQQLLIFSRGTNTPRQPIDPARSAAEMSSIIRQTFPRWIELVCDIRPTPWRILADSTQIHQVLLNLCVNARDAMPNGGTLTLRVENTRVDESIAAGNTNSKPGPYVEFTIADTGSGIPTDFMDRIFDPFFTTKPAGKGTGLGLSTALGIVKSHGGFFRVKSTPGSGSEFSVYLPALMEGGDDDDNTPIPYDFRGNGELILVIDDEVMVQHLLSLALENNNYRIVFASDGAKALALYSQHAQEVRLALTDMMMPHMDGKLTIQCLHKINPKLPIIAMSGMIEQMNVVESMREPGLHFLLKPFTVKKMLALIHQLLVESEKA